MDLVKISNFIKKKRTELGMTQEELAEKIFVTEKAISRWETGRGTPDISLLIPLAKELKVEISEILNGEENKKVKNATEQVIEYNEEVKKNKFNYKLGIVISFYILSIFIYLLYLKYEYNPTIEVNYFIRLLLTIISSILIILGNKIYESNFIEKIKDREKMFKLSNTIIFLYYVILLFNMVIFARYISIRSYNLIPFKTIIDVFVDMNIYAILINFLGNLIIFMPLEYFFIELFRVNKFYIAFALNIIVLIVIEILQLIFKAGVFDVDDIILGVLGMTLFYLAYSKKSKRERD